MKKFNEDKEKLSPLTIQLIREIKKPGRESLYDLNHRNYKNNLTRNRIWEIIGKTLRVNPVEIQKLWKYLKRKYITLIECKIGNSTKKVNQFDINLMKEMNYFKIFFFQKHSGISTNSYVKYKDIFKEVKEAATVLLEDLRKTKEFQLIEEMKKAGQEPLYDYANPNYKNNSLKKVIWENIGETLNISGAEVQKIWKDLKRKYHTTIKNETSTNNIELDSHDKELMKKMNYFRIFFNKHENIETSLDLDESNADDMFKNIELDQVKVNEFQLIEELKKPGREPLYDSNNPKFTNNIAKNKIWENVAEILNLELTEVQKIWKNLKRKYYYRLEREKSGVSLPKKLKPEEMLFMIKMSYFKEYFIANEQNSITITEVIKSDKDYFDKFSSEIYEFCDTTYNSDLDTKNPLTSESDNDNEYDNKNSNESENDNEFENKKSNEYVAVEDEKDLGEEEEHDQPQEEFYAPKRKKQKLIESATKAIENINVTHDAIIEKLISPSVNSNSKKTVISTFVSYLEAVLETKTPKVQNKIISEINEILKSY